MNAFPVLVRLYGEKHDGQWSLICLEFNLAVQAETIQEAQAKLDEMMRGYVRDALEEGVDAEYGVQLLRRRAPAIFWAKYYLVKFVQLLIGPARKCHLAKQEALPMKVVAA